MSNPVTVTVMPTETPVVPDFRVAGSPWTSFQATNLDLTQTVSLVIYEALGDEDLAPSTLADLLSIGPEQSRVVQINTTNISRLEVRGTTDGAGAQVRVATA
jgi:hypothetical protein